MFVQEGGAAIRPDIIPLAYDTYTELISISVIYKPMNT
jgi:hypothetical protein